jgi:hypothetical protein
VLRAAPGDRAGRGSQQDRVSLKVGVASLLRPATAPGEDRNEDP